MVIEDSPGVHVGVLVVTVEDPELGFILVIRCFKESLKEFWGL